MPRYYFTAEDGTCYPDEEGCDLPDAKAAASMAIKVLAEHLLHAPEHFAEHDCLLLHVTNDAGLRLLTLTVTGTYSPALGHRSPLASM